jgi:putative restriction endonuclease
MTVRHWWVNHTQTARQEIEGGYLWSAKKNRNGTKNSSYDNVTRTRPGDVVFSYANAEIDAIGVVMERVRSAPIPTEAGRTAELGQTDEGWLLPVRFERLSRPLVVKDHMRELRALLPARQSPIRATGNDKPGVYLTEIPSNTATMLGDLLGGQLQGLTEEIALESDDRLSDLAIEEEIWQRTNLSPRAKRQLISARIGQGIFRENVERIEKYCRVTGVLDRRHLRASHIKAWKLSDDREKLDGFNGLLFSPHMAHLFDRGHIAFTNDGRVLISEHLNPTVMKAWGLEKIRPPQAFRPEQWVYLDFHRRHFFEKVAGGRRV